MSDILRCFSCGASAVAARQERDQIMFGQRKVSTVVERMRCEACGIAFYTPAQLDAAQRAASDEIRHQEGLLRGAEIRAVRERLQLTQYQFEQLLGVGPKTVVRWEKGTVFQNRATDLLIRLVDISADSAKLLGQWNHVALPVARHQPLVPANRTPTMSRTTTYASVLPPDVQETARVRHRRQHDDPQVIPIESRRAKPQVNEGIIPAHAADPSHPVETSATAMLNAYAQ